MAYFEPIPIERLEIRASVPCVVEEGLESTFADYDLCVGGGGGGGHICYFLARSWV